LFKCNKDDVYPINHVDYLFNQWHSNEKTLLYTACQEGKDDIVEYLLDKGLNTKVKSKIDNNEYETPLQVAARWNYVNIVNLLLEKGNYEVKDIQSCLKMPGLKPATVTILKSHFKTFQAKKGCACF
jgi:ankyrin repeat protein